MVEQDKCYFFNGIIQLDEVYSDKQATIPLFAKIKVSDKLSMKTVADFVTETIEPGSKLVTDCFGIYNSFTG
jgi:hypothetical protein